VIVYADILIILNLAVDYFLLHATAGFVKKKVPFLRILLSAVFGGISSLYIFLPQSHIAVELSVRIITCSAMTFVAFGFVSLKEFLRTSGVFFGITCLYAGVMTALWHLFKPNGMVINNSVVYFDISAITLIISTVIFYFVLTIISHIFSFNGIVAQRCRVSITADGNTAEIQAIVDTGNSLKDPFSSSEIIITDRKTAELLFGQLDIESDLSLKSRYRTVPLNTVSGLDMLHGFRCDSAVAVMNKESVNLNNPIIAISKTPFDSGINGIINPKIFRNAVYSNASYNKKTYK